MQPTRNTAIASFSGSLRNLASSLAAMAAFLRVLAARAFFEGMRILDSGFRLIANVLVVLKSRACEAAHCVVFS